MTIPPTTIVGFKKVWVWVLICRRRSVLNNVILNIEENKDRSHGAVSKPMGHIE